MARQVLLIEDSATDARLVLAAIAAGGPPCAVGHAPGLAAGLSRLAAPGVDVVLLDLHLPESQGIETLRRVQDAAPGTPVVVVTGTDDEAVLDLALRHGAHDVVVKGRAGFATALRHSLRHALERAEVLEALRLAAGEGRPLPAPVTRAFILDPLTGQSAP